MKMLIAHDGACIVVRLAGRLDGESAEQLSDTLDRLLREGQRNVLLDLEDVTYLSSPGTQVLNRAHQEFSSVRGELKVGPASAAALEALSLADLKSRLVVEANPAETLTACARRPPPSGPWTSPATPGGRRFLLRFAGRTR
jgi:anti-anti-sigma factor